MAIDTYGNTYYLPNIQMRVLAFYMAKSVSETEWKEAEKHIVSPNLKKMKINKAEVVLFCFPKI